MLGPDRRFRDPSPEEIAALDLEGMRTAVMRQIHAGNVEVRAGGRLRTWDCLPGKVAAAGSMPKARGPRRAA